MGGMSVSVTVIVPDGDSNAIWRDWCVVSGAFPSDLAVCCGFLCVAWKDYINVVTVNYLHVLCEDGNMYKQKRFPILAHVGKSPILFTVMQFRKPYLRI